HLNSLSRHSRIDRYPTNTHFTYTTLFRSLPYTEHSRRYLLDEGFKKENIFVTGSPMREVLEQYEDKINTSDALTTLNLEPNKYIDRKSTRLNSSHVSISYAVFCVKKKKNK